MQIKEFVEATHDLEDFFDKELRDFERKQWFEELQNMTIERYRQIIKESYRKCKFLPKLVDILNFNNELAYATQKKQVSKVHCDICKGIGAIFYKKVVDGFTYDFVARCECENGLNYAYDGTKVKDSKHRSDYYIPTLSQINLKI